MEGKVGIGLRRDIADEIIDSHILTPDFLEFAPENWMGIGGYWNRIRQKAVDRYPVTCHGLSLSLGSAEELDWKFIGELKNFLDENRVEIFSEHLSYTKSRNAHLYDLLPIPFRKDAVDHVVDRIRQVQDFLERPLAIENVSYYTPVAAEMTEIEFVNEIVERADCKLLLDVNNVYVNAFNHKYDAHAFIDSLPLDRVAYIHMAGHQKVEPDLIIDTHGQPIIDPVYELFEWTIRKMDPVPVLLERDYNFDELEQIQSEILQLKSIIKKQWKVPYEA
ncbi:MAG: hypothetical protein DRI98_05905 [Bacteroidetes bacterium]|nr:MAG: hypothetical protein DRI98_05905 [Bacteroidota bacterium]